MIGDIYRKVDKYFVPPIKRWFFHIHRQKRFFQFHQSDVQWKDKYGYPSYERTGIWYVILFGRITFGYSIHSPGILKGNIFEDDYWEQIIWTAIFCNGDLEKAKSTWPGNWIGIYER